MIGFDAAVPMSILAAAMRMCVPIALAAIGGTFSERSGIMNLGLEGMMLMGAFGGALTTFYTGNPWLGVLTGIIFGAIFGLLHAVLCINLKVNQALSGITIPLLALGLTTFLLQVIWGNKGQSEMVTALPTVSVPLLKDIPLLGILFDRQNPLVFVLFAVVILAQIVLFKTSIGLKLRAIGENPEAADSLGLNVNRTRYFCVVLSGALAGLGGVSLSLGQLNFFQQNMTAGRGWIAVAANIFGRWNPLGVFVASIVFTLADAVQQHLTLDIPVQLLQMIPYVLTIIVMTLVVGRVVAPAALGRPFERGEK
ncbi:MAG: ABC transporter permease [Chloroflexi bacterium]|nr:ABC transporter permease [Chloroflexota bacterium]MCL5074302.1 ABC transporter permease [Chloroflexota bacterium]